MADRDPLRNIVRTIAQVLTLMELVRSEDDFAHNWLDCPGWTNRGHCYLTPAMLSTLGAGLAIRQLEYEADFCEACSEDARWRASIKAKGIHSLRKKLEPYLLQAPVAH